MKRGVSNQRVESDSSRRARRRQKAVLASSGLLIAASLGVAGAQPAMASSHTYKIVVGSSGVFLRSTPDTGSSSNIIGGAFNGDRVRVVCTRQGSEARGPLGSSTLWNKVELVKGGQTGFVNDSFVVTGSSTAAAGPCDDSKAADENAKASSETTPGVRVHTNGAPVVVRNEPSTVTGKVQGKYANGRPVAVGCSIYLEGRWWFGLESGGYVAAEYIGGTTPTGPWELCKLAPPTAPAPQATDTVSFRVEVDPTKVPENKRMKGSCWGGCYSWWYLDAYSRQIINNFITFGGGCGAGITGSMLKSLVVTGGVGTVPSAVYSCVAGAAGAAGLRVIGVNNTQLPTIPPPPR